MKLISEYDRVDCGNQIHAHIETSPAMIHPKAGDISWTAYGSPITPEGWVDAATIAQAEKMLKKHYANVKRLVKAGRATVQYKNAVAACKRLGMPTHYKTDLTWHDARAIAEYHLTEFLLSVRATGTWLWAPAFGGYSRSALAYDVRTDRDCHILYIFADDIVELTPDQIPSAVDGMKWRVQ